MKMFKVESDHESPTSIFKYVTIIQEHLNKSYEFGKSQQCK